MHLTLLVFAVCILGVFGLTLFSLGLVQAARPKALELVIEEEARPPPAEQPVVAKAPPAAAPPRPAVVLHVVPPAPVVAKAPPRKPALLAPALLPVVARRDELFDDDATTSVSVAYEVTVESLAVADNVLEATRLVRLPRARTAAIHEAKTAVRPVTAYRPPRTLSNVR